MNLFDPTFYRRAYNDLRSAYTETDLKGLANHYVNHGALEKRLGSISMFKVCYPNVDITTLLDILMFQFKADVGSLEEGLVWIWQRQIPEEKLLNYTCPYIDINNLVDHIYVINLDKERYKQEIFLDNNRHTKMKFDFFPGVDASTDTECMSIFNEYISKKVGYPGCSKLEAKYRRKMITYPGQIGYLKSMLNIFRDAKHNNYKKILIFDDDAILAKNFNYIFYNKYQHLKDKHIIRLGINKPQVLDGNTLTKSDNSSMSPFYKSPECDGSYSVLYSHECFDFFIKNIKYYNIPFDSGVLRDYKKSPNAQDMDYTLYPYLCIPDVYASSITGKPRDLLNFSKHVGWDLSDYNFVNSLRKVSVIIPLYNKQNTVISSVKSIIAQTYKNIEIIIVDDCSSDRSVSRLRQFLKKYNGSIDIKLITHRSNKGCYSTRNTGLRHATGDYIAFQDPDDVSLRNRLETQMNDIIKTNVMLSFTSIFRLTNLSIQDTNNYVDIVSRDLAYKNTSERNKLGMVTSLIDVNLYKEYGLYDESYKHSLDLWHLQKIYLKKFNLNNQRDIYDRVERYGRGLARGAFHTFIKYNLDTFNFIHYNDKLCYICDTMDSTNITNINYERDSDYNSYLIKNGISL